MLATYEVLMKELVYIDRFFESSRERRAGLTAARSPGGHVEDASCDMSETCPQAWGCARERRTRTLARRRSSTSPFGGSSSTRCKRRRRRTRREGRVHVEDASMTCPRHVPQAPTSYAAGRTVRLVRAVHRWAVSGTPMEAGRLADIRHLINFVAGEASQLEAVWRRAAEGGRHGEIWPRYGRDTVVALELGQARGRGW